MNITFETLNQNQNNQTIDNKITGQSAYKTARTEFSQGYSLEIGGNSSLGNAYQNQGVTAEEIALNASTQDVSIQRDYMTVMSSAMSEEDFKKLQEEGYNPNNTEIETAVTVVDQIKVKLAKAGVEIKGYTDDIDKATIEKITGSQGLAQKIITKLQGADAAVTTETISDATDALKKAEELTTLKEGTMKYMVQNNKEASIEEVYRSQYSASSDSTKQGKGYYADETPGYYAKKADTINWQQLQPQMEKVITEAGSEVEESTLNEAKWLVEKGIPLNSGTFSSYHNLKSIEFPLDQDKILTSIANSIAAGNGADQALLSGTGNLAKQAAEIVTTVSEITPEAVEEVVAKGQTLNIANLKTAMAAILSNTEGKTTITNAAGSTSNAVAITSANTTTENQLKTTIAKRQLEEVRLAMTAQANYTLLKNGYSVETTQLEKLVEDLKAVEKQQKAMLYGTESEEETLEVDEKYTDLQAKIKEIPTLPAAVLGKVIQDSGSYTLNQVYEQGTTLKNAYMAANQSYEALMTAPRSDLGDSIKKAFRNVDELLEALDIETSEENRKAVRILGYNQMEITKENLTAIKSAELTLSSVIEKMTPQASLQLIRKGSNPLNLNLEELNTALNETDVTEDAEKYSKFLYKLEKNNEITKEEKESYIGIYRLLRQIEKSDGSVIGSLVNQGAEVNFKNLLSAVRTQKAKGIDYTVDDDFGGLSKVQTQTLSISEQINAAFSDTSYQIKLASEAYQQLEPEKLKNMVLSDDTTLEEIAGQLKKQEVDKTLEENYQQQNLEEVRSINKVSEGTLQTLLNYNLPITVDNLLSGNFMINARGETFKNLFKQAGIGNGQSGITQTKGEVNNQSSRSQSVESDSTKNEAEDKFTANLEEQLYSAMAKLHEGFTDQVSATTAYENLKKTADLVLNQVTDNPEVTAIDVKAIAISHKQLSFASQMAKEENYEVPVKINGEITSINLKILHNEASEETGKVQCTFSTENLGQVAGEFYIQDEKIQGYVVSSSRAGLEELKSQEESLRQELATDNRNVGEIQFLFSKSLNINSFSSQTKTESNQIISQNTISQNTINMENTLQKESIHDDTLDKNVVSTKELYEIAKAFIKTIQNV